MYVWIGKKYIHRVWDRLRFQESGRGAGCCKETALPHTALPDYGVTTRTAMGRMPAQSAPSALAITIIKQITSIYIS